MGVDIVDGLGRKIALEPQPDCRNLPARVAELPANPQSLDIPIELDVANCHRSVAVADPDHPVVCAGKIGALHIGQRMVNRLVRLGVERAES